MNKLLTKIANSETISKGLMYTGMVGMSISGFLVFLGSYYIGMQKGAKIAEVFLDEEGGYSYEEDTKEG